MVAALPVYLAMGSPAGKSPNHWFLTYHQPTQEYAMSHFEKAATIKELALAANALETVTGASATQKLITDAIDKLLNQPVES